MGSRTQKSANHTAQQHMDFLGEIGANVDDAEIGAADDTRLTPPGNGPDEAVAMGFRVTVLTAGGRLCGRCRHRSAGGDCAELGVQVEDRGASRCDGVSARARKEVA